MGIFASKRISNKANIVLVHGFWADGSRWRGVIPTLQAEGHFVIAEQNAATSLADDVATTCQILAELEGSTLLVGHSYGGFVISEAANDAPGVVGLVYISAFILDEGETLLSSGVQFPSLEVFQHLLVSAQGWPGSILISSPRTLRTTLIQRKRVFSLQLKCPRMRVSSRRKPGGQPGSPYHRGRGLVPMIA